MDELTDEQFRQAHRLLQDNGYAVSGTLMKMLAPLLQLPWDEPTDSEIDTFANLAYGRTVNVVGGVCRDISQMVLREFVRRRNAALLPKPVDPRREKIVSVLLHKHTRDPLCATEFADEILAALDAPQFGVTEPDTHTGCVPSFYESSVLPHNAGPRAPFKPNAADEVK